MSGMIRRIWNSGVFWAQAVTVLRTFGFIAVLITGLRFMEPAELGLWYLIVNITQLGSAIELGFSSTIARFASYFMAGKHDIPEIGLSPSTLHSTGSNLYGLAGLVEMSRLLYRRFSFIAAFNILIIGSLYLTWSDPPKISRGSDWLALMIMGFGSAVNMTGLFWHALLHGINQVRLFHIFAAFGLLSGYIVSIAGLASGFGLPAMATGIFLMSFVPRWLARRVITPIVSDVAGSPMKASSLWPMTWRSGTAALAGYMILGFTTVIAAQTCGLEFAGSYGLCMQLAVALHGFSSSWLAVKTPVIAQLFSQGHLHEIRSICKQRILYGMITYVIGAAIILVVIEPVLSFINSKTAPLDQELFALLLLLVGLDLWVGFHAAAILAANRVPHLVAFVVTAIASVCVGLVAGTQIGPWGVIVGPLLVQAACNYWFVPALFWRTLKSPPPSAAL